MTAIMAICVAVTFAVSIYLLLGRELKGIAMGVFLLSHAANLSILAMSRSPVLGQAHRQAAEAAGHSPLKNPPVLPDHQAMSNPLATLVDPLPQALILTAIVIGFGVMGLLLTLIVVTGRQTQTLDVDQLADTDTNADADADV